MKKVITVLAVALLTACGGESSNGGNSGANGNIYGKAIDGYVEGATVYLDLNFNGIGDSNEPTVVTGVNGTFDLSVGEYGYCADHAPLIVNVPVGAYDTDLGIVDKAYQMQAPPRFLIRRTDASVANSINVTPLTSVLWTLMKVEMSDSMVGDLSCDFILSDSTMIGELERTATAAVASIASSYNVTPDDIFVDFIAGGRDTVHQKAMLIVDMLKASYALKNELALSNPDAIHINAYISQQENGINRGRMIKYVDITTGNTNTVTETLLNEDLTFDREHKATSITSMSNGEMDYSNRYAVYYKSNGEITCNRSERISAYGVDFTVSVTNTNEQVLVNDTLDCWEMETTLDNLKSRAVTTSSRDYVENTWTYNKDSGQISSMVDDELLNTGKSLDTLDAGSILTMLNGYDTEYASFNQMGADIYVSESGVSNDWERWIVYGDGDVKYEKLYSNADGSVSIECGTDEYTASQNVNNQHFCTSW